MARLCCIGRVRTVFDYLRTSLWFVPVTMMVATLPLTACLIALESFLSRRIDDMPWFIYVSSADDAREIVSTLLSSMVTMVSLLFSITMVVLTLAARQFGPRLVRNFMGSAKTQIILGVFVMTIVYCLLILASIGWRSESEQFPYLNVTITVMLFMVSVGLLIIYLHGLARSIMSETIIGRVGREFDELIKTFDPLSDRNDITEELPDDFEEKAVFFGLKKAGYVQAIDLDGMAETAERASSIIKLGFRAGDFVVENGLSIGVYPATSFTDDMADAVRGAIMTGAHRTPVQDPTFPIRHMVEIAVRALSPGVNDPYTAAAVVDQLSACLSRLMERRLPPGRQLGQSGKVRVFSPSPTYASLISTAFDQIRQNGADKPMILIHMIEAIRRIVDRVRTEDQLKALRDQLVIIKEAGRRNIEDPSDLADVITRADDTMSILKKAPLPKSA